MLEGDKYSVFSVLGGKSWSVVLKGSSAKRMLERGCEFESVEMEEQRYWMLSFVVAIVMMKPVLCWICLASARNGMR